MSSVMVAVLGYGLGGVFTILGCLFSLATALGATRDSSPNAIAFGGAVALGSFLLAFACTATTHVVLK